MIKHLKPREFSGDLKPLIEFKVNKEKCIKKQKWDEASEWRDKECEFMIYGIDIRTSINVYLNYIQNIL
jgi:hypothetical protein